MHRKASWEFKREGTPPHNKCRHASIGLSSGIHLGKSLSMHLGKDPWMSQVWRKNQDNWPEVNKDPEGLSYISGWRCLCTVPLLAKSRQSCPTLCDPINGSPPDSLVPGILQARTLEWVAIGIWSYSNSAWCPLWVCLQILTVQEKTFLGKAGGVGAFSALESSRHWHWMI